MASTAMFAPYDPASAMARRIVAPITGNAYQIDPRGSALVDVSDVAWFQTQGFSATPIASAGQSLMYAPYMADEGMTGPTTNLNTGNTYFINAAGAVAVATADIAWFQTQGYALVPTPGTGFSLMSTQVEVGQALSGPLFSPITGNMYVMNGQGWIVAATADVAWLQGQGFAPVASGGVAPPVFPPVVGATQATIAADFAGQQYWASATSQASFAAWLTAIGGTYTRASSATYLQGGVVKTAAANAPRFPTDAGGVPQGIRLTGAATNIHLQSSISSSIASYNTGSSDVLTANATVDPSGGAAAASFVPSTLNTLHLLYLAGAGVSIVTGTSYVFSAYVKPFGPITYQASLDPNNLGTFSSVFTLTGAGSVVQGASGVGTIQQLANGWYLITQTFVGNTTGGVFAPLFVNGNKNYIGDGVSGLYVWGMQYTATAFPCDYIPTTTATVTQAADSFSFPFTQTTFSALVGTNGIPWDGVTGPRILDTSNTPPIYIVDATHFALFNGAAGFNGPAMTSTLNSHKGMAAGNTTNSWLTADGLTPTTSAIAIRTTAPTTVFFGSQAGTANFSYGNFSQLAIWNGLVASTAEMQRLTT